MRPVSLSAALIAALFLTACSREKAPEPLHVYKVGQKVQLGHVIYTVIDTNWFTQMSGTTGPRFPQHRFFVVRLNAVNSGGDNIMLPNLSIEDEAGNSYQELSNGEGVPNWAGYLRRVGPAESALGNIVFDAPPKSYKLRIADETGEKEAYVDIPLSLEAGTAETVKEEPQPSKRR